MSAPFGVELGILLGFLRLGGFFAVAPFPGLGAPPLVRLLLAGAFAWAFSPAAPAGAAPLWSVVLVEVALGLGAGFSLLLALTTFQLAGEAGGQQMGLGMPGQVDYSTHTPLTLMGQLYGVIAAAMFLAGDGPGRMAIFLSRFLSLVPPGGGASLSVNLLFVEGAGRELMSTGLQVAAPLLTAVFAAQLVLAVLARTVPTLNLFLEGPAFTVSSGLIGLWASLETFSPMVMNVFDLHLEQALGWWG